MGRHRRWRATGAGRPQEDRLCGAFATVYSSNVSLINRLIEPVHLSQVTGSSLPGNHRESAVSQKNDTHQERRS